MRYLLHTLVTHWAAKLREVKVEEALKNMLKQQILCSKYASPRMRDAIFFLDLLQLLEPYKCTLMTSFESPHYF